MNIDFRFLLLGTILSLIPTLIYAQCVATTGCASLGYTETSCPNGKGIKCPFGSTFACPETNESVCNKYGFKYECSGTGYASGNGSGCNNKYASCVCTNGYEWKDGKCQTRGVELGACSGYAKNCAVGQILNSDGTCSDDIVSGKEPVGVVIYIGDDNCGYAMTANSIGMETWRKEENILSLPDYTDWQSAVLDYDSCLNTQKIIQAGDSSAYPVVWRVVNYAPRSHSCDERQVVSSCRWPNA